MAVITHPSKLKTDREKYSATVRLLEEERLEHNRQRRIALSDPEKYIKSGRWYQYALRPANRGSNIFRDMQLPLIREKIRLQDKILQSVYSREAWKKLPEDEQRSEHLRLLGDANLLATKPTLATSPLLEQLKQVKLDLVQESPLPPGTEDFGTFTEVDSGDDITRTTSKVDVVTMDLAANSYVYKDYTSIGDFEHTLKLTYDSGSDNSAVAAPYSVFTAIGTVIDLLWGYGIMVKLWNFNVEFWEYDNGTSSLGSYDTEDGGVFPLIVERATTTGTCKIYNEAMELLSTLSGTVIDTSLRYIHVTQSNDTGSGSEITFSVENLDLQAAPPVGQPMMKRWGGIPYMEPKGKGVW